MEFDLRYVYGVLPIGASYRLSTGEIARLRRNGKLDEFVTAGLQVGDDGTGQFEADLFNLDTTEKLYKALERKL